MTSPTTVSDAKADLRFREWHVGGEAGTRRRATAMARVMVLIVAALAVWLSIQLF
jgi:hypothetical protein